MMISGTAFQAVKRIILISAILLALMPTSLHAGHPEAVRFSDLKIISFDAMVDEVLRGDIIIIGEYHEVKKHHETQLRVIRRIRERTPRIVIGLEMLTFKDNPLLEIWVKGQLPEAKLRELFRKRWTYSYDLYRDIFRYAREKGIPVIGLNVPRSISWKVREKGFASLSEEEFAELPSGLTCNVTEGYREFIRGVLGHHGRGKGDFEKFCEAQMLWDQTMALLATKHLKENIGSKVVVLAGMAHAWKPAIPFQLGNMGQYRASVILPDLPDVPPTGLSYDLIDYLVLDP